MSNSSDESVRGSDSDVDDLPIEPIVLPKSNGRRGRNSMLPSRYRVDAETAKLDEQIQEVETYMKDSKWLSKASICSNYALCNLLLFRES